MDSNLKEYVNCSECGYEYAAANFDNGGKRTLRVHDQIKLTVIDKEKNLGLISCPKCGGKTQTNLEFWYQF